MSPKSPQSPETTPPQPSRRRVRRRPMHGVLVAIDAPQVAEKPWVVDAIDINANGVGLVLPPEIPEGTEVFLSFALDEEAEFSRVPATVLHQMSSSGGVRFATWSDADRLRLLEYLVRVYETVEE